MTKKNIITSNTFFIFYFFFLNNNNNKTKVGQKLDKKVGPLAFSICKTPPTLEKKKM